VSTARNIHMQLFTKMLRQRLSSAVGDRAWDAPFRSPRMKKYLPYAVIVASIAVVYRWWLNGGIVTGGDWGYGADAHLREFVPIPSLWDGASGTGSANILAGPVLVLNFIQGLLVDVGIGYAAGERLVWLFPCLLAGALATYALTFRLFSSRLAGVVAACFVAFNYYTLAIMAGGQLTVIDASLLMPVVLWLFYRALHRVSASRLAPTALVVGVQVMYDIRSTYLTLGVLILFSLYFILAQPSRAVALRAVLRATAQFIVIGVVVVLMHLYWLLPGRYAETIALPAGYTSVGAVGALSYFRFDSGFALFQPPPNTLIGPLFFLLPILAFGVLLWRRATFIDMFLITVALLAIFFVRGDNPPAGNVYDWMFTHFPGFSMYRDPSKFYQPLTLAYALLLGRVMAIIFAYSRRYMLRTTRPSRRLMLWVTPLVCFIPIVVSAAPVAPVRPYALFDTVTVPREYQSIEHYLERQHHFSRTLWVFGLVQYIGNTTLHPAVDAQAIGQQLQPYAQIPVDSSAWLLRPKARNVIESLSVEYIVVGDNQKPGDSASVTARNRATQAHDIALVHRGFPRFAQLRISNIYLFRDPSYLPPVAVADATITKTLAHVLLQRSSTPAQALVQRRGTLGEYPTACRACLVDVSGGRTRYEAVVRRANHPFLLVLSQSFDPNWVVYIEPSATPQPFWWTWTHAAVPHRYHTTVNGFANAWWIDKLGTYRIVIEYWPQRLTDVGFVLCWLMILSCIAITVRPFVRAWLHRRRARTDSVDARSTLARSDASMSGGALHERVAGR